MKKLASLGDIKEAAQLLDTAAVQWLNANPPDAMQKKIQESRMILSRVGELADSPLRLALVGEFNSGKTLVLNALLDSCDLFPSMLQPTTGNVLEVRVTLRREESPVKLRKASVTFFNQIEVEEVLRCYLKDLQNQGLAEELPNTVSLKEIQDFENAIIQVYSKTRSISSKYGIISALEFITALRFNESLVLRQERHTANLPVDLIGMALTLPTRQELDKDAQGFCTRLREFYDNNNPGSYDRLTANHLRALFPLIRRVNVEVTAWSVPFGIQEPEKTNPIALLDFPGLGAESSSARDYYLCTTEIKDAHAVVLLFNGANPGSSGASVMATMFQRMGKLTPERTLVTVNRFDEFHPLPTNKTVEEYYAHLQQGTTVGFCTLLVPAKNLFSASNNKFNLYLCSALGYLFEEKSRRPQWNFGAPRWFNDNKRQAAFTLYKRLEEDFRSLISAIGGNRVTLREHQQLKDGLDRYLQMGGIPSLRQDLVRLAMDRGERLMREDSLKELRHACRLLDELAPAKVAENQQTALSPEVTYAAQEFYRVLELATADMLPSGPSHYRHLKVRSDNGDKALWDQIEQEIAVLVASWPEWFSILNEKSTKAVKELPKERRFGRYSNLKRQGASVPEAFHAFDERFRTTAESLTQKTLEYIHQAILYSLDRFENHPDYRSAVEHLQSLISVDKLSTIEEALPLFDAWTPSKLAGEDILPTILERIDAERKSLESLNYPYDGSKPCSWNLALVIRILVQMAKTLRDRVSRLVAAAENQFQAFFCGDVLRANILPLVRTILNNAEIMGAVALKEAGASWESVGQGVRSAVDEVKAMEGFKGSSFPTHSPGSPRVEEKKTVEFADKSTETSAEEESGETFAENASPDEDAASDSPATDSADRVTPPTQTLASPMGHGSPRAGAKPDAKPLLSPKPMSRRPGEKPDDRKNLRGNLDKE